VIISESNLQDVFSYHRPDLTQLECIAAIRTAATDFAAVIIANAPTCADQQAALRHVREALMTANAAVVLRGKI